MDLSADLDFARSLADTADTISLERFRAADLHVTKKADSTHVTDAAINDEVSRRLLTYVAPVLDKATHVNGRVSLKIDKGDVPTAVSKLRRLMSAGDRHPLVVMSTLGTHYQRMLKLDGAGIRDETDAAKLLGMKGSTFPAKKALSQTRTLGSDRIVRAIQLLARADLDIRGATAMPSDAVMEVLVARLAQNSRRR